MEIDGKVKKQIGQSSFGGGSLKRFSSRLSLHGWHTRIWSMPASEDNIATIVTFGHCIGNIYIGRAAHIFSLVQDLNYCLRPSNPLGI